MLNYNNYSFFSDTTMSNEEKVVFLPNPRNCVTHYASQLTKYKHLNLYRYEMLL